MEVGGRFRAVRRSDHAVPERPPRPLGGPGARIDIRIWRRPGPGQPLLLATAPRKAGSAVERNTFRRRARMACLAVLRDGPGAGHPDAAPPVIWIRPAKGLRVRDISYAELEGQLRLAFSRLPA